MRQLQCKHFIKLRRTGSKNFITENIWLSIQSKIMTKACHFFWWYMKLRCDGLVSHRHLPNYLRCAVDCWCYLNIVKRICKAAVLLCNIAVKMHHLLMINKSPNSVIIISYALRCHHMHKQWLSFVCVQINSSQVSLKMFSKLSRDDADLTTDMEDNSYKSIKHTHVLLILF